MKRLTTLLGCCAFFLLFSFSASSQQVIFTESFDNGDPFIAGIATTQYQLLAGNCPQRAYRIGPNLNSICPNSFPNSPAPAGNCMSTNEGNNEPATRDLYSRPNQALSAGNYTVSFSTAHRYTQNQFPFVGRIGIFSGATQVGTINVPFGTNWTGSNLNFTLNNSVTGFTLRVMNPNISRDFAIDNIGLVRDICHLEPTSIRNVPDCVDDGEEFTITLRFDEPVTLDMIDEIYSTDGNFEYVDHSVFNLNIFNIHIIRITFRANGCSCVGEMLKFDLRWTGCTNVLWLMTDPIPCCESNCDGIDFQGGRVVDECVIINGSEGHEVCMIFDVSSGVIIEDILPQDGGGTCPTTFSGVNWTVDGGSLKVCGYIELDNPDCEFGDAVFYIQTNEGCCEVTVPFSFPDPCDETGCIDQGSPDIQIIRGTGSGLHSVNISVPGAANGQTVTVTDNKTGETSTYNAGLIQCGPWQVFPQGGNPVGTPCTGIRVPADFDCSEDGDGADGESCYSLTVQVGECTYIMTGDYCDEWIVEPIRPTDGGGSRSANTQEVEKPVRYGDLTVYPNPIRNGNTLMVQQKELITGVQIISINGQVILQQDNLNTNSLELPIQNIQKGMYILRVQSEGDEIEFKRISIVE